MLLEWISLLLLCQCFVQDDRHTERGVVGPHTSATKQSAYFKGLKQVRKSMVTLSTEGEGAKSSLPMLENLTAKMQVTSSLDK